MVGRPGDRLEIEVSANVGEEVGLFHSWMLLLLESVECEAHGVTRRLWVMGTKVTHPSFRGHAIR